MALDPASRRQVEAFVRPLYAGLDGVETFSRVARLGSLLAEISGPEPVDGELLELLLLFHGAVDRLGSLAAGGRLDLFLTGLGLPPDRGRRVRAGLERFGTDPEAAEERLLHDALLLDSAGVAATVERLLALGRRRVPLARALATLDPGPPPERYRTPRGAALGAARRRRAEEWIADLRQRVAAEQEP